MHGESFEFTYTLHREGDSWVITDYAYGYAPLPLGEGDRLTPIPIPSTITTTVAITPAGQ